MRARSVDWTVIWSLIVAGLILLGATTLVGQVPPTTTVVWSHPTAVAENVNRFELSVDEHDPAALSWTDVGMVPSTGVDTWEAPLPALQPGSHTVSVRACNVVGCGAATAPLAFDMVIQVPSSPNGVTLVIQVGP